MPLSDDEQRRLDEIEHALHAQDPDLAALGRAPVVNRRWLLGGVLFALGAVVLVVGLVVTAESLPVGIAVAVVGALLMGGAVAIVALSRATVVSLRRH